MIEHMAGRCFEAAPIVVYGRPVDLCVLTAGHVGAHRCGTTEWTNHPAPKHTDRDLAHAVALERESVVTYLLRLGLITGAVANVIRAGAHNEGAK